MPGKKNYKCEQCGLTLKSQRGLTQHVNQKHADNNNNNNDGEFTTCHICNRKFARSHIARHKKICKNNQIMAIVNFIFKIITIYNNNIKVENYIGNDDNKKKQFMTSIITMMIINILKNSYTLRSLTII
jgi:hypothetical protein